MSLLRRAAPWCAGLALLAGCSAGSPAPRTGGPSGPDTGNSPSASGSASAPGTVVPSGPPRVRSATVLSWQLPGPLSRAVAMPVGGRILLAGGLEPGDHSTDQVLTLDPRHGGIGQPGRLAEPLHDSAGAVLSGRPTVIGGGGSTELAVVQRQDAHGRWQVTGRLPGARSDLSVVATGTTGLVIGGYDGVATPTSILRTATGSRFQVAGALPTGLRYSAAVLAGGAVWVLGGEVNGRELDEVLRLDPATGRVRTVGRLPVPLGHEAVAAVGHRLLVMGGRTAPHAVTAQMWWYDTRTGTWTRAGRLPYPVADAPSVTLGHSAYLLGGETLDFTARVTRVDW